MKISIKQLRQIIKEAVGDQPADDQPTEPSGLTRREEIASVYSDVYKEKNGFRPRWINWDEYTTEEMEAELDMLYSEPGVYDWTEQEELESEEPEFRMAGEVGKEDLVGFDPLEDMSTRSGMGQSHWQRTRWHGPNVNKR